MDYRTKKNVPQIDLKLIGSHIETKKPKKERLFYNVCHTDSSPSTRRCSDERKLRARRKETLKLTDQIIEEDERGEEDEKETSEEVVTAVKNRKVGCLGDWKNINSHLMQGMKAHHFLYDISKHIYAAPQVPTIKKRTSVIDGITKHTYAAPSAPTVKKRMSVIDEASSGRRVAKGRWLASDTTVDEEWASDTLPLMASSDARRITHKVPPAISQEVEKHKLSRGCDDVSTIKNDDGVSTPQGRASQTLETINVIQDSNVNKDKATTLVQDHQHASDHEKQTNNDKRRPTTAAASRRNTRTSKSKLDDGADANFVHGDTFPGCRKSVRPQRRLPPLQGVIAGSLADIYIFGKGYEREEKEWVTEENVGTAGRSPIIRKLPCVERPKKESLTGANHKEESGSGLLKSTQKESVYEVPVKVHQPADIISLVKNMKLRRNAICDEPAGAVTNARSLNDIKFVPTRRRVSKPRSVYVVKRCNAIPSIKEEEGEQGENEGVEEEEKVYEFPCKMHDTADIVSLVKNMKQRRNALCEQSQTRSTLGTKSKRKRKQK